MKFSHRKQRPSSDRGMVLVAILWVIVLQAMLATALLTMSRVEIRNVGLDQDQLQAGEVVRSAINLAVVALTDPNQHWRIDGVPQTITIDKVPVSVTITSESGKIDLNYGSPDLIRGLLTAVGEGPSAADEITNEIVARREKGGFSNPAELLQFPEVSRDLYGRLASSLTLYSASSSVDISVAPIDVLLAIPGNTRADAEAEMARRTLRGNSPDATRPALAGQAYTIKGNLSAPGIIGASRTEIIRLTGNARAPIFVLQVN